MAVREGEDQRHDADSPDEHRQNENPFANIVPAVAHARGEADGAEGGDAFEKDGFEAAARRVEDHQQIRGQKGERRGEGEDVESFGNIVVADAFPENDDIAFPAHPRPEREQNDHHGGRANAAAGGNGRRADEHQKHDEEARAGINGHDVEGRKAAHARGNGHEEGIDAFFVARQVSDGTRIVVVQQQNDGRAESGEERLRHEDEFCIERKVAPIPFLSDVVNHDESDAAQHHGGDDDEADERIARV